MENKLDCQTTSNDIKRGNVEFHKIYSFDDLSFGKLCSVNRDIRPAHVKKILRGLESGTWHRLGNIMVDKATKEIVDGNHRYKALSAYYDKYGSFNGHKIYVEYYDRPQTETLADAIKFFNDDRKAMTSKDYTHVSECNGNQAIPLIREFGMSHKLTAKYNNKGKTNGYSERYTYAFIYGKNVTKDVKDGSIEIDEAQLKQAEMLYKEVENMIDACSLKISAWFEPFIQAWYEVRVNDRLFQNQFKKIDFKDFCEQVVEDSKDWSMDKTTKSDWTRRFNTSLSYAIE